jgi:flagellar motor switch protein FliN/FliY
VTNDAPLLRLGCSTAEAIAGALETFVAGGVRQGAVQVRRSAEEAVAGLAVPAVVAEVSYVDGVAGGNLFMLPVEGARRLAAAMKGQESAISEAMSEMVSAAAHAMAGVLGEEVEIAPPEIKVVQDETEAAAILAAAAGSAHIVVTDFAIDGAPARLVQLVPNAFVVRMTRALDEITQEYTSAPLGDSLRTVPVRVWAELGRARMAAGASLGVATGSVLELDREVDEPIDLYVDGMRFATGRLLVAEDGSLQLEIEQVLGPRQSDTRP